MIRPLNSVDASVQDLKPMPVHPSDQEAKVNADVKNIEEIRAEEELRKSNSQNKKTQEKESEKITQEMLDEIADDVETLHSVGLKFSKHKDTDTTMIKVMDRETDELIREIPAENILDMAAKMEEMIGLIFDKNV